MQDYKFAGKDCGQEEKGATEGEMAEWHPVPNFIATHLCPPPVLVPAGVARRSYEASFDVPAHD